MAAAVTLSSTIARTTMGIAPFGLAEVIVPRALLGWQSTARNRVASVSDVKYK